MISLIGYIAMACLITSGIPQALRSIKQGNSNGIAGGFIILTLSGFVLMSLYLLLTKPIIPVLLNYSCNIIVMSVIGYYKLWPRKSNSI
jgi:uncharacterized protein with PQ loop repeat